MQIILAGRLMKNRSRAKYFILKFYACKNFHDRFSFSYVNGLF